VDFAVTDFHDPIFRTSANPLHGQNIFAKPVQTLCTGKTFLRSRCKRFARAKHFCGAGANTLHGQNIFAEPMQTLCTGKTFLRSTFVPGDDTFSTSV
jgi:hypothetical protein